MLVVLRWGCCEGAKIGCQVLLRKIVHEDVCSIPLVPKSDPLELAVCHCLEFLILVNTVANDVS